MQIISRIRIEFDKEISLEILFKKPILKDLSNIIDETNINILECDKLKKYNFNQNDKIPLSFNQERL
jgi:hypothetical protein